MCDCVHTSNCIWCVENVVESKDEVRGVRLKAAFDVLKKVTIITSRRKSHLHKHLAHATRTHAQTHTHRRTLSTALTVANYIHTPHTTHKSTSFILCLLLLWHRKYKLIDLRRFGEKSGKLVAVASWSELIHTFKTLVSEQVWERAEERREETGEEKRGPKCEEGGIMKVSILELHEVHAVVVDAVFFAECRNPQNSSLLSLWYVAMIFCDFFMIFWGLVLHHYAHLSLTDKIFSLVCVGFAAGSQVVLEGEGGWHHIANTQWK